MLKKQHLISLFCFLISCKAAKETKLFYENANKTSCQTLAFKQVLPIVWVHSIPTITIQVKRKNYVFSINTVDDLSFIDSKVAKELELVSLKQHELKAAKSPHNFFDYTVVKQLEIGKAVIKDAVFLKMNIKKEFPKIDGTLGSDILSKFIWQLKLQEKEIVITSHLDSLTFSNEKQIIPFSLRYLSSELTATPFLKLQKGLNFVADVQVSTGFNATLSIPKPLYKVMKDTSKVVISKFFNEDKNGELFLDSIEYIIPRGFNINGTMPIGNPFVTSCGCDILHLGNDFLSRYDVTFDWKHQQLIFDNKKPPEINNFLIDFAYCNQKVIVIQLIKNSTASKEDIKLGDEIVEINGINMEKMPEIDFENWEMKLKREKVNSLQLKIKRNNQTKEVLIKQESYFD